MTDFNEDWYTGNLNWLKNNTVFLCKAGSHSYGTNIETSDLDIRGVCIAPKEYYLGFAKTFEQAESKDPYDAVVFDIRKFFKLAAQCNPNIIELLFTAEENVLLYSTFWHKVVENKYLFLSKKARHTFAGYAHAQLGRIKTHRHWLLNPPSHKPTRKEFDLPEHTLIPKDQLQTANAQVQKELDRIGGMGLEKQQQEPFVERAGKLLGFDSNFIYALVQERKYGAAMRNWDQYQTWKAERNATRASLEAQYGYDTKHGGHLVRLMRMCREILDTGQVLVKRPDAQELISIRNGAWTYDQLIEWAEQQDHEMDAAYEKSTLPFGSDTAKLDKLLVNVIEDHIQRQNIQGMPIGALLTIKEQ